VVMLEVAPVSPNVMLIAHKKKCTRMQ